MDANGALRAPQRQAPRPPRQPRESPGFSRGEHVNGSALLGPINYPLSVLLFGTACSATVAVAFKVMAAMDDDSTSGGESHLEAALLQMGAKHPRRYLRRNPARLDAYWRIRDALSSYYTEESFHAALIAFCAPDPEAAASVVPAVVRERGWTSHASLLALLGAPPALSSGAL